MADPNKSLSLIEEADNEDSMSYSHAKKAFNKTGEKSLNSQQTSPKAFENDIGDFNLKHSEIKYQQQDPVFENFQP